MDISRELAVNLDGFDPLSENFSEGIQDRSIFEEATKRIVSNILKSYTNYFDVFSELIQNALDAIDVRTKNGDDRQGIIRIEIDIPANTVTVMDNGIGMSERELRYCFRPSVSFKSRKESRGHKGVGATFLAYGFSSINVSTKKNGERLAIRLSGGREWAEDIGNTHSRPRFSTVEINDEEFYGEPSGTSVSVHIGNGNRPDLTWWSATSAHQWLELLKIRTPLGGVYLSGQAPATQVIISVIDSAGQKTTAHSARVEYPWPHEIGGNILPKIKTIKEAHDHIVRSDGDSNRIAVEFKNLSAMWDIWSKDDLLDEGNIFWSKTFDESEERLIRLHDVCIYGCFMSSAKSWGLYQSEVLRIRRTPLLLKGGMQIASDYMVQGDLSVIPLTSTIGYQANSHVVIHFRDGNPDMGRKVFQPEIKALSEKISRQVVNIFKRYIHLMREDSGSPTLSDSTELFEWKVRQMEYERDNQLEFIWNDKKLAYGSQPRSEQDVIALFHEMVAIGIFDGYRFISTSQNDRYDSCFRAVYDSNAKFSFDKELKPLGVGGTYISAKPTAPMILEYKFDLDGLIADFSKDIKFDSEISLLVCWQIGDLYEERYRVASLMIGEEGATRQFYGSTHSLWYERQKKFEIICLKDVMNYFRNADALVAEHQSRFVVRSS